MFFDKRSGRSATKETLATAGTQESRAESKVVERTDTVYVEKRDSVYVQGNTGGFDGLTTGLANDTKKKSGFLTYVKWITALVCAVVGLVVVIRLKC